MKRIVKGLMAFVEEPFANKLNRLSLLVYRAKGALYYRNTFGSFGKRSVLFKPMLLTNPECIHIGNNVSIRKGARLEAIVLDPNNPPELHIGDNVNVEQDVQIVFVGKVRIASNVSITARCVLLCGEHPFLDVDDPVKIGARLSGTRSFIEIGEGSFIGTGVVIQPNVRIGKYCVVGSNSVVKKSVPEYTVVDGHPASVVMQYDFHAGRWVTPSKRATVRFPQVS